MSRRHLVYFLSSIIVSSWTPAQAETLKEQYQRICGSSQGSTEQFAAYCTAAKSAVDGTTQESVMWKVYAGVASVCTIACGTSLAGVTLFGGQQYVCSGSSLAAGLTDAVVTKNYSQALQTSLTSLTTTMGVNAMFSSSFGSMVTGKGAGTLAKGAAKGAVRHASQSKDIGSCIGAAVATVTSVARYSSMKQQEGVAKTSLNQAMSLIGGATVSLSLHQTGVGTDSQGYSGASGAAIGGGVKASARPVSDASSCADADNTPSAKAVLSCAASTGADIPLFFKGSKYPDVFRRLTGKTPDQFFSGAKDPASAISGALSGALSSAAVKQVEEKLSDLESRFDSMVASHYVSAGAPQAGSAPQPDPDLLELENLIKAASGQKEIQNPQQQTTELTYGGALDSTDPELAAGRTDISLFVRISHRYGLKRHQMTEKSGGQLPIGTR